MEVLPAYDGFEAGYRGGRPQVVWTKLVADLETPVSAMMKLAAGQPNAFLLESVEGGETWGRHSIIGLPCRRSYEFRGHRCIEREFGASSQVR